jgi:hypothetical protein
MPRGRLWLSWLPWLSSPMVKCCRSEATSEYAMFLGGRYFKISFGRNLPAKTWSGSNTNLKMLFWC